MEESGSLITRDKCLVFKVDYSNIEQMLSLYPDFQLTYPKNAPPSIEINILNTNMLKMR